MIARSSPLTDFLRETYVPLRLPSGETFADYATICGIFDEWFKGHSDDLWAITPEVAGHYLRWLMDNGRSANTARKHSRTLRTVLKVAKRRKLLSIDFDEWPMPAGFSRAPRAWSMMEYERLVATARQMPGTIGPWPLADWLPALMLTCLSTNWRITAVMGLRTASTSLANRSAFSIESKQHAERCARLTTQTVEALQRIWGPREEVFGDWPYDRSTRQWKALNNLLGVAIEAAEVPDIGRWHAFRKTGCTMIWDRLGPQAAAGFAGHFSPATTEKHYVDKSKLTGPSAADAISAGQVRLPLSMDGLEWI